MMRVVIVTCGILVGRYGLRPALQTFYGALDDEQKARLCRDMAAPAAPNAPQTSGRREGREYDRQAYDRPAYSSRRHRARAYASADRAAAAPGWGAACEQLAAVLRGWPVREIERDVRLSGAAARRVLGHIGPDSAARV